MSYQVYRVRSVFTPEDVEVERSHFDVLVAAEDFEDALKRSCELWDEGAMCEAVINDMKREFRVMHNAARIVAFANNDPEPSYEAFVANLTEIEFDGDKSACGGDRCYYWIEQLDLTTSTKDFGLKLRG